MKNFVLPEVDSDAIWGAKLDDSHHFYIRAMTWKCLLVSVKVLTAGLFLTKLMVSSYIDLVIASLWTKDDLNPEINWCTVG